MTGKDSMEETGLLRQARLAYTARQAQTEADEYARKQKAARAEADAAKSAVRQILPADMIWDIQAGGPIEINTQWKGTLQAIQVTVDGLEFAYVKGWSSEKESVWMRYDCPSCGQPIWNYVRTLEDIGAPNNTICETCDAKLRAAKHKAKGGTEKQHTLAEHVQDAEDWWQNTHRYSYGYGGYGGTYSAEERQKMWFVAYERWMNDRPLLTDEDPTGKNR